LENNADVCVIIYKSCRFVNDPLHIGKRKEHVLRRVPVKGTHGEIIISTLADGQLFLEIIKGIERMGGIEFLVILSVAALNLAIMARSKGTDEFMTDPKALQRRLK
jgi:hypothetical protein